LTSLIREKITRATTHAHLHFEPYELFWQPDEGAEPVRVHHELFTSEAFIQAHRELQDSPGEPGCDLPRVVLGLMFASDGTQLTSFSTAKLWPVYAMIGNESKDRRSKPSCHAFEHVAYLETVREFFMPVLHGPYLFIASRCLYDLCSGEYWRQRTQSQLFGPLCSRNVSCSMVHHPR
jgi:hypothetical protein